MNTALQSLVGGLTGEDGAPNIRGDIDLKLYRGHHTPMQTWLRRVGCTIDGNAFLPPAQLSCWMART